MIGRVYVSFAQKMIDRPEKTKISRLTIWSNCVFFVIQDIDKAFKKDVESLEVKCEHPKCKWEGKLAEYQVKIIITKEYQYLNPKYIIIALEWKHYIQEMK